MPSTNRRTNLLCIVELFPKDLDNTSRTLMLQDGLSFLRAIRSLPTVMATAATQLEQFRRVLVRCYKVAEKDVHVGIDHGAWDAIHPKIIQILEYISGQMPDGLLDLMEKEGGDGKVEHDLQPASGAAPKRERTASPEAGPSKRARRREAS
jgi:hypothetical protein